MEFILEFFLTFWLELAMKIVPQKAQKKSEHLAKTVVLVLVLYVIAAFTAGSIMLADDLGSRTVAVVFIVSSVVVAFTQVVLGLICYLKNK